MFRTAALSLATAALLAGCYVPSGRQAEFTRSWDASAIQRIEVGNDNGRIEIEGSDEPTVELRAIVKNAPRDGDPASTMEMVVKGDTLVIRAKRRHGRVRIGAFGSGPRVDYEIRVPRRFAVDARNVNGRTEVEGVEGRLNLRSVNGGIEFSTSAAEASASTVNARIEADFREQFRGATFKTVNGSIRIAIPRDSSLDLDIHQINGSFRSELPVVVRGDAGRGSTHGSLHGGQFPLEIHTVNGSVRLGESIPVAPAGAGS